MKKEIPKPKQWVLGSSLGSHHHGRRYQGECQRLRSKSRCRHQKTATGEVLVGPLLEMVNFSLSETTALEILYFLDPSSLERLGRDQAFYQSESQQTPQLVGLKCPFGRGETRSKVAVVS